MIDWVKIALPRFVVKKIINDPEKAFVSDFNHNTGEVLEERKTLAYKGFKLVVYNNYYGELSGSLHKLKNDGIHNADLFSFSGISEMISNLEGFTKCSSKDMKLSNLEFGHNLTLNSNPNNVIENLIIMGRKRFYDEYTKDGRYKSNHSQRHVFKVYNKSKMYTEVESINKNLLRVEMKYKKMAYPNLMGIHSVSDLKCKTKLSSLQNDLENKWNKTLLWEPKIKIPNNGNDLSNPKYWLSLNYNQLYYNLNKYVLIQENTPGNLKGIIMNLIKENFKKLIDS